MEDTTMDRLRHTNAETNDKADKKEQDGASDQVPLRSGQGGPASAERIVALLLLHHPLLLTKIGPCI